MAEYPNTGSILDSIDVEGAKTRTSLSTQILIYVNDEPVGAVQSFTVNQTRTNKDITEVGTDGIIEYVPNSPAKVDLTVKRMMFDGLSITEAMSRSFTQLSAQRMPFDIVVFDKFSGGGLDAIVTTYHNCWFNKINKTYSSDNYLINEDASLNCEYMSSTRGGVDQPVTLSQGINGGREIPRRQTDETELAADAGINGRRGTLDYKGLISAAY
tara:strand:+ start:314 stop:952 length:639 start_codon:yes stop_codon:yes gene_type:complete